MKISDEFYYKAGKEFKNHIDVHDTPFYASINKAFRAYQSSKDTEILDKYIFEENSGWMAFLNNYSIQRNIGGGEFKRLTLKLLFETFEKPLTPQLIDETARKIQKLGYSVLSSSGKHILPLGATAKNFAIFRPDIYPPYDTNAVQTMKLFGYDAGRNYTDFYAIFNRIRAKYSEGIKKVAKKYQTEIDNTEARLKAAGVNNFNKEEFAMVRLTDKLLWIVGEEYKRGRIH